MRALVLALVASVAWAQSTPAPRFRRFTTRTEQGRNTRGLLADSFAFFEFAPASGAGMPAACSSTAPTGAKGEALTFTRTGSATCTKTASGGLATTGIANGDLVTVAGNVARVEYDSQGVLGLRVESSRTNSLLWSEDFTNAVWSPTFATVTANFAVSPDGATTADRLQLTGGALASVAQTTASIAGPATHTFSVYLRSNSGTPQVYCFAFQGAGSPNANTAVTLSTSSWTRCAVTLTTTGTATVRASVGWDTSIGMTNPGTVDVLAFGAQFEQTFGYATSYIPTTTAAATRNAERAILTLPVAVSTSTGSHAASYTPSAGASGVLGYMMTYGANASPLYRASADLRSYDSTTQVILATTYTAGITSRVWGSYAGALQTINNGVTQTTGAFDGSMPTTTSLDVGSQGGGFHVDGIVSRACADPDPARCR